jgi:hypothetical protein
VHASLTTRSAEYLRGEETDTIDPRHEMVEFESMTPTQRRTFEAPLADEDNRVEVTEARTEVWNDHRAVSYRGERYEVYVLSTD